MFGERGFSLVELVVSSLVLAVGVLAVAASFASVARLATSGARLAGATLAASAKVEELRSASCRDVAGGSDVGAGGYERTWDVTADEATRTVVLVVVARGVRPRRSTYVVRFACLPA